MPGGLTTAVETRGQTWRVAKVAVHGALDEATARLLAGPVKTGPFQVTLHGDFGLVLYREKPNVRSPYQAPGVLQATALKRDPAPPALRAIPFFLPDLPLARPAAQTDRDRLMIPTIAALTPIAARVSCSTKLCCLDLEIARHRPEPVAARGS